MWGAGLLGGLRITLRNMLRGPITVKYPHEKVELPDRARWAVEPTFFEDGAARCTGCLTCVRVCPDHILSLDVETREDKSKRIVRFDYEIGACMMCGLCVEACPFDAIEMGHDYELAVTDPAELRRTLLADVDAASAAKHREAKAKAAAVGSESEGRPQAAAEPGAEGASEEGEPADG